MNALGTGKVQSMRTDALAPIRAVLIAPDGIGPGLNGPDGTTPETEETLKGARQFLDALTEFGIVALAVKAAPFSRATAYRYRAQDEQFKAEWDAAIDESTDTLVREAWRRATEGVKETWTDKHGNLHTKYSYSDNLLMFLIKSRRPQEYRDNATIKHEFEGPRLLVGPRPAPALPPPQAKRLSEDRVL